jgi:hypothetical protein
METTQLRDKSIDELTNYYQGIEGKDGILSKLYQLYEFYDNSEIRNFSKSQLIDNLDDFKKEYRIFSDLNSAFLYKENRATNSDKIRLKGFIESTHHHMYRIQNLYINTINQKLIQMDGEKAIRKAKISIYLGWASVGVGVVSIILGFVLSIKSNRAQENFITNKNEIMKLDSSKINQMEFLTNKIYQILKPPANIDSFNNNRRPIYGP